MGGKAARNKGNNYELRIAHILSDKFKRNFRRVPRSGAWDKQSFTGDIYCKEYFVFSIECKNQKVLNLRPWIDQAAEDASISGKEPCVIFHINRCNKYPNGDDFICLKIEDLDYYTNERYALNDYTYEICWKLHDWLEDDSIVVKYNRQDYAILRLDEFLEIITVKRVKKPIWSALKPYLIP